MQNANKSLNALAKFKNISENQHTVTKSRVSCISSKSILTNVKRSNEALKMFS